MTTTTTASKIAEAAGAFVSHLVDRGRPPETVRSYAKAIELFVGWLVEHHPRLRSVDSISAEHIRAWTETLEVSPTSIGHRLAALTSFWRFLVDRGLAAENVAREVPRPAPPKRRPQDVPKPVTDEEFRALLGAMTGRSDIEARDRAILRMLRGSGLTVTRLSELSVDDFECERIEMTRPTRNAVLTWLRTRTPPPKPEEPLFVGLGRGSRCGQRMDRRSIGRIVTRAGEAAGVKVDPVRLALPKGS
ncbi:MAG: tyrosine-type recombinase/integrase [Planctomycetota bacterium JB042]